MLLCVHVVSCHACVPEGRFLTGQVDQRTIEKYEKEAKEKAGGSWYLAFIMDTNEDERAKVHLPSTPPLPRRRFG